MADPSLGEKTEEVEVSQGLGAIIRNRSWGRCIFRELECDGPELPWKVDLCPNHTHVQNGLNCSSAFHTECCKQMNANL